MMIDFSTMSDTKVFSGRKNGVKARDFFKIQDSQKYYIKTTDDQLVTSSYFLGLLGEILSNQFSTPNEVLNALDFKSSNDKTRRAIVKAIKRGLSNNRGLV